MAAATAIPTNSGCKNVVGEAPCSPACSSPSSSSSSQKSHDQSSLRSRLFHSTLSPIALSITCAIRCLFYHTHTRTSPTAETLLFGRVSRKAVLFFFYTNFYKICVYTAASLYATNLNLFGSPGFRFSLRVDCVGC